MSQVNFDFQYGGFPSCFRKQGNMVIKLFETREQKENKAGTKAAFLMF